MLGARKGAERMVSGVGLISVDDHVIEPTNVWVDRVPGADRDRVPHVVEEDGHSVWVYEDKRISIPSLFAQAGRDEKDIVPGLMSYRDMRPAYYDAASRAKDMDTDGIIASLCFPTIPRYCGQLFLEARDRDLALGCIKAYNDWTIEEWAGGAPGRFIPLMITPLWDPVLAAAEVERCAGRGARAVSFSENPAKLGLPSLHDRAGYWDPLLSAINDTGLPICIHFGSSSMVPNTADDAPIFVSGVLSPLNLTYAAADWVFCGKLERFPNLRICLSEGGIGWMPYFMERADYVLDHMRWARRYEPYDYGGVKPLEDFGPDRPPSELFREHIYGCFIDDSFGVDNIDRIGVDHVMMEADYPHGDGTYPRSMANADRLLAGLDADTRYKIMQGNARRVFDLPEPEDG
jgi:predicted TIM-barrel fold metal-dependent hydrolase